MRVRPRFVTHENACPIIHPFSASGEHIANIGYKSLRDRRPDLHSNGQIRAYLTDSF